MDAMANAFFVAFDKAGLSFDHASKVSAANIASQIVRDGNVPLPIDPLVELEAAVSRLQATVEVEELRSKVDIYELALATIAAALPFGIDNPTECLQTIETIVGSVEHFQKGVAQS